jgi:hypothetical protein
MHRISLSQSAIGAITYIAVYTVATNYTRGCQRAQIGTQKHTMLCPCNLNPVGIAQNDLYLRFIGIVGD